MTEEGLQMGEDVHFVVFGIFVVVKTRAVRHICVSKMESYCILFF